MRGSGLRGVGLREQGRFARLAMLLRAARPTHTQLVLPASTTLDALARAAQGLAPLKPCGMMMTRLDEVTGLGVILNVIDRLQLAVTCYSTGQNIPDDLENACGRRIGELLFAPNRPPDSSGIGQQ